MAKKVSKKVNKKADASLEVKTPYPKKERKLNEVYDNLGKLPPLKPNSDYWGEKMVKLQDRINELELTVNDMHLKLNKVANRMGL
jgi:hypothetical protein|tara:strand:+ start:54 stop:308 length:255 start_codon:yes stop_codon:yes gene_type:complete